MNVETLLKEDLNGTLIVCPNDWKNVILERLSEEKKIIDVKFLDLNEYRKRWYFDHDLEAVRYVMKRDGISIDNAEELLQNLFYVEKGKSYESGKLNELVRLREELDDRGLLIYDRAFRSQVERRRVIVIGYGTLGSFDRKMFSGEVVGFERKQKIYEISCFEDIETETEHLYDRIFDLILNGTDINDISILCANEDYEPYFKRFNSYYPFTVFYPSKESLGSTLLGKEFIGMLESAGKEEIWTWLQEEESEAAGKLMRILNSYPEYELKDVKDFIVHDVNSTQIMATAQKDVVQCRKMYTHFSSSEHVFLIGFNDTVPAFKRDTEYLTDDLKEELGMDVTAEENRRIRSDTAAYLSQIEHLHLSFCMRSPFKRYNPNDLFPKEEYSETFPQTGYSHSAKVNQLRYGYMLDRYVRYRIKDEKISLMHKYYGNDDYSVYDNKFKGLRQDQIHDRDRVTLSYSSMDEFYRCSFRYYLKYVLGLNEYEDTFYTLTGTLCHEVLKDLYQQKDFDFEKSWSAHCRNVASNEKEAYFLEKLKEELRGDIRILKQQDERSLLEDALCEQKFENDVTADIRFKGLIDKVKYRPSPDGTLVSVIDYKTGNTAIREDLMPYGMSLQLPSYMYLISRDDRFGKDVRYCGLYLQHLLNSDLKYREDKDLDQVREDNMKLSGFTTSDVERASVFDMSLEEGVSRNISNLKLKKDGTFYAGSPTKSDEQIKVLISLTEEKTRNAGEKILNGEFPIDPKVINEKNESCQYCPYASVCYHRSDDLKRISTGKKEGQ